MKNVAYSFFYSAFLLLWIVPVSPASIFAKHYEPEAGLNSFINPNRLQSFELGISTTFEDRSIEFNAMGDVVASSNQEQNLSLSFGGGLWLWEDGQAFFILPLIDSQFSGSQGNFTNSKPGDLTLGGKWIVLDNLFYDRWYPSILIFSGTLVPTGSRASAEQVSFPPTKLDGVWKPFVELGIVKESESATMSLNASFSKALETPARLVPTFSTFELAGSVVLPALKEKMKFGGGAAKRWTFFGNSPESSVYSNRISHHTNFFINSSYFLSESVQLSASLDYSIPIKGLGKNDGAVRSISFALKYGSL